MPLSLTICDDSALARKQMAKSLPANLDARIYFASGGEEALQLIRRGCADLMLLDLNMPGMDGYQVLETIHQEDLPCLVIVVSGDIQQAARDRVKALGAIDFLAKPYQPEALSDLLLRYGITSSDDAPSNLARQVESEQTLQLTDLLQETINIAMGQAGQLLGSFLDTFVHLPIPKIHQQAFHQLIGQLHPGSDQVFMAVSQGFSGSGIIGEAILILEQSKLSAFSALLPGQTATDTATDVEIMTDLAALLSGACLKGFAEQLDLRFSLGSPILLGQAQGLDRLLNPASKQESVIAVEIDYRLPEPGIECDLLLVFTQDSLPALIERTGYLA